MKKDETKLGALFYPTRDQNGLDIPFDSLFIPYIYREIYFDGVYLDVLNQRKDMVIVDVGSNIGITVDHFRPYAKKIYAIEPSPEHFTALKKNKEFNNWDNVELFNVALADKDGEMEFSQNTFNRTMNTLALGEQVGEHEHLIRQDMSSTPLKMKHQGEYKGGFKVKTMAIDTFFKENNIEQVDFMKFDPEGAEDLILRSEGFKKIADKIKAIEIEFHFPTWQLLVSYMESLGFEARRYEASAIIVLFTKK